ncbi:MAG: hypothetical protein JO087_01920 [Actinobacteria bacterium]|nr:hypothetical protein [Actinomycetota bacterium]
MHTVELVDDGDVLSNDATLPSSSSLIMASVRLESNVRATACRSVGPWSITVGGPGKGMVVLVVIDGGAAVDVVVAGAGFDNNTRTSRARTGRRTGAWRAVAAVGRCTAASAMANAATSGTASTRWAGAPRRESTASVYSLRPGDTVTRLRP